MQTALPAVERDATVAGMATEQTIRLVSNGKMHINPVSGQHFHST